MQMWCCYQLLCYLFVRLLQGLKDIDATFVSEVYSGVLRYKNVALVVTEPFYNTQGKGVPLSDQSLLNGLY